MKEQEKFFTESDALNYLEIYKAKLPLMDFKPFDKNMFDKVAGYLAFSRTMLGSRGIALIGNTGNGKTTALKAVSKILDIKFCEMDDLRSFYAKDLSDGSTRFKEQITPNWSMLKAINIPCPHDLIVDDVGKERVVMSYGDKVEVFAELVDKRYTMWKERGAKLLFSSNLSIDDFNARYGKRTISRLNEMCTIVPCDGKDRRLIKGV